MPELFCLGRQRISAGLSQNFVKRYRGSEEHNVYLYVYCCRIAYAKRSDFNLTAKAKGEKENEEDYVFGPGSRDGTVYGC